MIFFNLEFDIISYFAAIFTVIGAFFLVRSILESGAREIAAMAGTYYGSNPHLEFALAKQKADSLIGFSITFFGGLLWLATVFCVAKVELSAALIVSLLVGTIVLTATCFYFSKTILSSLILQTRVISFCHHVEGHLRINGTKLNPMELIEDAKQAGLEDLVIEGDDPYDTLVNILMKGGVNSWTGFLMEVKGKSGSG